MLPFRTDAVLTILNSSKSVDIGPKWKIIFHFSYGHPTQRPSDAFSMILSCQAHIRQSCRNWELPVLKRMDGLPGLQWQKQRNPIMLSLPGLQWQLNPLLWLVIVRVSARTTSQGQQPTKCLPLFIYAFSYATPFAHQGPQLNGLHSLAWSRQNDIKPHDVI